MTSNGRGLGSDALLKAAIAAEHVDVVAHHRELGLIVAGRHVTLSNSQADAVRQTWWHNMKSDTSQPGVSVQMRTLAKRTGGHLNTGSLEGLRVARRLAAHLTEFLHTEED